MNGNVLDILHHDIQVHHLLNMVYITATQKLGWPKPSNSLLKEQLQLIVSTNDMSILDKTLFRT